MSDDGLKPPDDLTEFYDFCVECGLRKPVTAFAYKGTGRNKYRKNVCLVCTGGYSDRKVKEKKAKATRKVQGLVAALRGKYDTAPNSTQLAESMIALFGGVEAFAVQWKEQIDSLIERSPGSKTVLDQFAAIGKLLHMTSELRQKHHNDTSDMSIEEIEAELSKRIPALMVHDDDDEQVA